MSKIYEQHTCKHLPSAYFVLKSAANGWIIAINNDGIAETAVIGIKRCPFCGEKLVYD